MAEPRYTVIHSVQRVSEVSMRSHPRFLPQVVSKFHTNKVIHLLVFFSKPHTGRVEQRLHPVGIHWAIFYLDWTRPSKKNLPGGFLLTQRDSKDGPCLRKEYPTALLNASGHVTG